MKDRKVATRYARALLEALPDDKGAEEADRFLTGLSRALDESDEFRTLIFNPAVPRQARLSVLEGLAAQHGMHEFVANFLRTIVAKNRAGSIASIAEVFHEERERAAGIVPAEITTAIPLTDDLVQRARTALERATGKRVQLTTKTDPELLGGAVTRLGSTMYDGSLRTQLARLRTKMMQE
jgi:F-type H+-transporting ATPase subunit delta